MNRSAFSTLLRVGRLLPALLLLVLAACGPTPPSDSTSRTSESLAVASSEPEGQPLFQCAMHPNVVSDKPGNCPICGMELQEVKKLQTEGIPGRAPVPLSAEQRQLINIRSSPVREERVDQIIRAPGIIRHPSSKIFTISAWTSGRINRLYVDEEEMVVAKGEKLYGIYSPELFTTMNDYLRLQRRNADSSLLAAARTRLRQHGLSKELIAGLDGSNDVLETLDVPAPQGGLVMKKMVRQGDYVKEGDPLFTIVDLSELWLLIDIYESELPFVKPGQKVSATTIAVPGKTFTGVLELINHHIDPKTRSAQARVTFENSSQYMEIIPDRDGKMRHHHLLLPGMWMNAEIKQDLGKVLVVPAASLFDTGRQQYVFIEKSEGIYVPKLVEIGPRVGDIQVIRQGLEVGDLVVTDGNFLLDSESQLRAAASGSTANEASTHHGHGGGSP